MMNVANGHGRIFQFDFQVNRRDNGTLAGFTLDAQKQGEAEFFCKTFPKALFTGKGSLGICSEGLVLRNALCPFQPAVLCLPLEADVTREFKNHFESGGIFKMQPSEGRIGFCIIHD
jgi:hypothetical protein